MLGHREAVHHHARRRRRFRRELPAFAVGVARVDHQRLAGLARQRDLRRERALLVGAGARCRGRSPGPSRRSPTSARAPPARAAPPGPRRRSPSRRWGGGRSPRTPAGSPPPSPAPRGTSRRRCPPSAIRVTPPRPPPPPARCRRARTGQVRVGVDHRAPRRTRGLGNSDSSCPTREPAPAPSRARLQRRSAAAERRRAASSALDGMYGHSSTLTHAQAHGQRAQHRVQLAARAASSFASCHGARSST